MEEFIFNGGLFAAQNKKNKNRNKKTGKILGRMSFIFSRRHLRSASAGSLRSKNITAATFILF